MLASFCLSAAISGIRPLAYTDAFSQPRAQHSTPTSLAAASLPFKSLLSGEGSGIESFIKANDPACGVGRQRVWFTVCIAIYLKLRHS